MIVSNAGKGNVRCNFCDKNYDAVQFIISTPPAYRLGYICDECVEVCKEIVREQADKKKNRGYWFRLRRRFKYCRRRDRQALED